MSSLKLKPNYKIVQSYYDELNQLGTLNLFTEGNVSPAFASLLRYCANQYEWILVEQFVMKPKEKRIRVDGVLLDMFKLIHGVWEAKDSEDDLKLEVKNKFDAGYPNDNILFQAPEHAIIWQNGKEVLNDDISKADYLVEALKMFFNYQPPKYEQWIEAVEEFKAKVPELGAALLEVIEKQAKTNAKFISAFNGFMEVCKTSINPNLSKQAVEEMLIQHLLTERLFRKVFDNADFTKRNIIASEIEKVILALTSKSFSRHEFLRELDRFYYAIEMTAATIEDYSQKLSFLNTVYENFFQGFSVKVADTHGIVYTPQPIVNFMVNSVEMILDKEFQHSLSESGVHILDPFVGTGNFIIRTMREIKKTALPSKFSKELHCNEVLLLPYYISSMNIEHEYFELTGEYKPFQGICLVDTFELAEGKQIALFTEENTERVNAQKETPIFIVISNPPYNVGQVNENDNNKNRKYSVMDKIVQDTYSKDSKATNKNALSDVYVKAIKWASDRINGEGIVALVTNNSFIENKAFDGMRKHLEGDFDLIYFLDLGGNVRKNPKISGTTHNVFGIQVGVSINFLIKKKNSGIGKAKIYYAGVDELWRKEDKYNFLDNKVHIGNIKWKKINPDKNYNWITAGIISEFERYIPIGTKEAKKGESHEAVFSNFGLGSQTAFDSWIYNYEKEKLANQVKNFINTYNEQVYKWRTQRNESDTVDSFVLYDDKKIQWSSKLKQFLNSYRTISFTKENIRIALYRPFCTQHLYFDPLLTHRRGVFPHSIPKDSDRHENILICVTAPACNKPFHCLAVNTITDYHCLGDTRCFPFHIYNEETGLKQENITDWSLERFRVHYKDEKISKWDIFHYVYGVLHHPKYKETFSANLKRDLPRIPFVPKFWELSKAGKCLCELHVNFENQSEYQLEFRENNKIPLNFRTEKMKLSQERDKIIYNEFLTLAGIPSECYEYRLGNRSALEWIIDQYCIKIDKRSGIINDPNRINDEKYIIKLIAKVINISLQTVGIVKNFPNINL